MYSRGLVGETGKSWFETFEKIGMMCPVGRQRLATTGRKEPS
jgi:hypothetical protein